MKKIVVTGGSGRFGKVLKKNTFFKKSYFPTKNQLNILSTKSIKKYLTSKKPKILIHLAALSRPMNIHDKNISKSIDLNIIGTANIVKICSELKIKLIYFSTNYVYPSTKGNYVEESPLLPINNYAWSKLGGESAVQLYKNSLILRVCMAERPFIHKEAFGDFKTNFIFELDDDGGSSESWLFWKNHYAGSGSDAFPLYMDSDKAVVNYFYDRRCKNYSIKTN